MQHDRMQKQAQPKIQLESELINRVIQSNLQDRKMKHHRFFSLSNSNVLLISSYFTESIHDCVSSVCCEIVVDPFVCVSYNC